MRLRRKKSLVRLAQDVLIEYLILNFIIDFRTKMTVLHSVPHNTNFHNYFLVATVLFYNKYGGSVYSDHHFFFLVEKCDLVSNDM